MTAHDPGSSVTVSRLKLGVSSCLTGAAVRHDGGHCRDDLVELLRGVADLVPFCPEVAAGLGTPREAIRLLRRRPDAAPSLVSRSGRDLTEEMRVVAEQRADELAGADLDGYIVKKGSPSCGLERVRVVDEAGHGTTPDAGAFTRVLRARLPLLPVEDEGRLRDPGLRDAFLVRVFTRHAARRLFRGDAAGRWHVRDLVAFHASMKLLVVSRSPEGARRLGRIVAGAASRPPAEVAEEYTRELMTALAITPTRGRHVNALEHLAGVLRGRADDDARRDLRTLIDDYRAGHVALAVPLAVLRHEAHRVGPDWLRSQRYLEPYPRSLGTRSGP